MAGVAFWCESVMQTPTERLHNAASADLQRWWDLLARLDERITARAAAQQWRRAQRLMLQRRRLLDTLFERFPVGPATAAFYRPRLATLFSADQRLQTVAREATRQQLRIVRQ